MTRRTVVFDTWAWFEVLEGSPRGAVLAERYLAAEGVHVLTVDLTLAEASAALAARGESGRIPAVVGDIIGASSEVVPIARDDAILAGPLRSELRKTAAHASLADAVLLSVARNRKATLVSCDEAFEGQQDVVCGDAEGPPKRTRRKGRN